ncbi:MAG TPA: MBL fold metallo-hydrolase [Candidatus Binataceae bacterium]|nr:MBL fold metallo-hydrolase [Candidatus Binataceae bacterium]
MLFRELNRTGCKTYLAACDQSSRALIIDPLKDNVDRYLAVLAYYRLTLELIIESHTHADHRSGVWDLRDLTGAKIVMHRRAPAPHIDVHIDDGSKLELGSLKLSFIHTPGHAPDSTCIQLGDRLFTGDTLLIGGTGRTDFPGGDAGAQYDAITQKLFTLPDSILVFPAHDYRGNVCSTIGDEKRSNARIAGRSRDAYIALMNNLGMPLPTKIQEALQANESAIEDDSVKFPTMAQLNEVRQLEPAEVDARLHSGNPPILLDVREAEEFSGELGHIPGSILIPLRHLSERAKELEKYRDREIIAICRAGVRSTTAAAILVGLGFEHVCNMKGGMLDWNDAKLPVER